jgi:hypothetical protein
VSGGAGGAGRIGLYGNAYGAGTDGQSSTYWQSGEDSGWYDSQGGMGGGGYCRKRFAAGLLPPGLTLSIIISSGGNGNGNGAARLTWS